MCCRRASGQQHGTQALLLGAAQWSLQGLWSVRYLRLAVGSAGPSKANVSKCVCHISQTTQTNSSADNWSMPRGGHVQALRSACADLSCCRAVMSYLQVVGEQHHQLENHMAAFTSRLTELQAKHNMLLPGAVEVGVTLYASTAAICAFLLWPSAASIATCTSAAIR